MLTLTIPAKAFPPAKVIFTGISVLLGVGALALPFVDQLPLILNLIGGEGCQSKPWRYHRPL